MTENNNWVYSDVLKDHFVSPRNILSESDDIAKFDGSGVVGNIKCGDEMLVAIRVDPASGKISDCKWKTYGCASAIGSTSILSEMVKGMTLEQAFLLSPKDVAQKLGGLPEHKIHCSVLGDKALRAAINDYYRRHGLKDKVREETARIICQCMNVTDREIENAVLEGARTYLELQERTKLGTVCGQCKDEATRVLQENVQKHFGS